MQVKLTQCVIFTIILTLEAYFFLKKSNLTPLDECLTTSFGEFLFEMGKALFQLLNGYTLEAIFSL